MDRIRLPAELLPPGLIIDHVRIEGGKVAANARSREIGSIRPDCGLQSRQVHSRYARSLSDFPAHGRCVRIFFTARRFRCGHARCPRVTVNPELLTSAERLRFPELLLRLGFAEWWRETIAIR